ncbi:MAG TPA: NAD(P)-dependent oxidoreductase [Candidatus Tumulicola sp.]|jgi:UDP-glucose 4-epimerase
MKIFVTGAGGFIGRATVRILARSGHEVTAHVAPTEGEMPAPSEATACVHFAIENAAEFANRMAACEVVVHLAGPAAVAASFGDPEEYMRSHAVGTCAVISAMRRAGVRRLVYVSSAEIYGRRDEPRVREDMTPSPRSPYAAAKVGAEAIVAAAARGGLLRAVVLRPFSVYGPGQRHASLLARIIDQAQSGTDIQLRDLTPTRDYCFVDDVANAIRSACHHAASEIAIFNVGTGIGTSVGQLAAIATEVMGTSAPVIELGADRGASEIFRLIADPSHARLELGWQASVDVRTGIARTLEAGALA